MTYDWLFAPTDNINLLIEVAVGLVVTAWVAGIRSKRALVAWLNSKESAPFKSDLAKTVVAEMPDEKILVRDVVEAIPDPSDKLALLEERMGQKLLAQVDTKFAGIADQLAERVSRVVQANIASAKSTMANASREMEEALGSDNDGSMITEVAGMFFDEDTTKKIAKARRFMKHLQNRGQPGSNPFGQPAQQQQQQSGYPFGTIMNGYVATPSGWKKLEEPRPLPPPNPPPPTTTVAAADLPPELPPEPSK